MIAASQLGFTRPEPVALIGEKENEENTKEVVTRRPDPPREAEVLPRIDKKRPPELKAKEKNVVTDRPTAPRSEQVVTPKPLKGSTDNTNVTVGRTYGTPVPQVSGGIGVAAGGGTEADHHRCDVQEQREVIGGDRERHGREGTSGAVRWASARETGVRPQCALSA